MPLTDWLAALTVITAWGINFVVIKVGLHEIPPLLLAALRFAFVAFPAVFFVKRPAVPFRALFLYALTLSFGQFIFLFTAIYVGMPAGLASLVLQAQAFFTVLIAALVLDERVFRHNILGIAVAVLGLVMIQMGAEPGSVPVLGFILSLCAALSWACGNIVVKRIGRVDMLGLVVWTALLPPIPFLILSWIFEGPQRMRHSLQDISVVGIGSVAYLALVATIVGYVLWGRLLGKHPVSKVAPLSLLIPVIGLVSSSFLLGERLDLIQWLGGAVVMLGLAVNVFGLRQVRRLLRV
ncbi:EamA family transporter [Paralcaligenes ureilyticus]|uniref:O-acetylserine/cysteine efflux transporter n=1 Tax=Paralcaligenes ureilyticus TaxID=627131 RepID=A0A4R3LYG7_9BURK|nr:EamA family transporter [Paralcaligenes ureilyticus]TCT05744.1 O-acetylserine/cysteine efflux transporter [Paralcaligenes ureilyticus]